MLDMLGEFYMLMQPSFEPPGPPLQHLFPRALSLPGWSHALDLILRDCMCSLSWFPGWLQKLKAVTYFLRSHLNVEVLRGWGKRNGMLGLVQMICSLSIPNFAEWRWGTLYFVLSSLQPVLSSIIAVFPFDLFQAYRDQAQLRPYPAPSREACDRRWMRNRSRDL